MEPEQSWGIYIIPLSLLGVSCNWLIVFAIYSNKSSRHSFSLLTATQAAANGLFSVLYLLYVCPMIVFDLQVLRDNSHHVGYVLLICYDVNIHIHVLSTVNRFCAVFLPIMYNNVFSFLNYGTHLHINYINRRLILSKRGFRSKFLLEIRFHILPRHMGLQNTIRLFIKRHVVQEKRLYLVEFISSCHYLELCVIGCYEGFRYEDIRKWIKLLSSPSVSILSYRIASAHPTEISGLKMPIVNTTECIICFNEYDSDSRKPCVGTCGHSICEDCKHQMVSTKCPQCNREKAFEITIINYQVLELINHFKIMEAGCSSSGQSSLDDLIDLDEGTCSECTLRSRHLRLCITCAKNADQICEELADKFKGTINSLKKYFEHFNLLPATERKIEARIEKVNDTMSLARDALKRLDLLNKEFEESADVVKNNAKAVTKATTVFVNMDPVLVADRKQSAREPLLAGLFKDNVWTPLGRMPNPKSNFAVASNKSQIFVVGGIFNGSRLQEVELYDTNTKSRKSCAPMKRGRARASAGFHNNKIYVAGGYNSDYMDSVEVFDPDHETWEDGPSLLRPRADGAVVSCNGALFVLGGFNGNDNEEEIEQLMEQTQKFEVIGEIRGSRAGFGACEFRGRIYIAGGWNGTSDTLRSVRSYDPITNSWREEPSMNRARKYFTLCARENTIYAIRVGPDDSSEINEIEKFDVEGQKWNLIPHNNQDSK